MTTPNGTATSSKMLVRRLVPVWFDLLYVLSSVKSMHKCLCSNLQHLLCSGSLSRILTVTYAIRHHRSLPPSRSRIYPSGWSSRNFQEMIDREHNSPFRATAMSRREFRVKMARVLYNVSRRPNNSTHISPQMFLTAFKEPTKVRLEKIWVVCVVHL
jgi:hypothetical protein